MKVFKHPQLEFANQEIDFLDKLYKSVCLPHKCENCWMSHGRDCYLSTFFTDLQSVSNLLPVVVNSMAELDEYNLPTIKFTETELKWLDMFRHATCLGCKKCAFNHNHKTCSMNVFFENLSYISNYKE